MTGLHNYLMILQSHGLIRVIHDEMVQDPTLQPAQGPLGGIPMNVRRIRCVVPRAFDLRHYRGTMGVGHRAARSSPRAHTA